jgi:hypothetical protein
MDLKNSDKWIFTTKIKMNQEAVSHLIVLSTKRYVFNLHLLHQGGQASLKVYRRKPPFCPHWDNQNLPKFEYPASTTT